jgi:hypothetical protein
MAAAARAAWRKNFFTTGDVEKVTDSSGNDHSIQSLLWADLFRHWKDNSLLCRSVSK